MFSATIVFGASPVPWTLLFKTAESMAATKHKYDQPSVYGDMDNLNIEDDYGQVVSLKRSSIHGIMFEDMSKSRLAHIERGLHQMRTQIDADNMGKSDPVIMAHMRARSAQPGVLTPFGPNGAFPRQ